MYFSTNNETLGFLYNNIIPLANLGLKFVANFNQKIASGVKGRSKTFSILKQNLNQEDKTLWFHCASLGEYEQGLPVFSALRQHYKNHKILLTFFSPSGYEIRKNAPIADLVVYLPLDTKSNAKRFLDLVNPELTVFVKYDIWPNYLNEVRKRHLRAILISAAFRKNQRFFKFYGGLFRHALFAFEHIFTQNETSKTLLESINYLDATVSGDTRFDRVSNQINQNNTLDFVETFKQDKLCIVAGSTWPEDESLLIDYLNTETSRDVKFIIAPHNIKKSQINNLKSRITPETVLFSEKDTASLEHSKVLIIDTIGLLTKIYSYANIAYVGGAIGNTGLHNTLEPAVFGIPIIIGNHHEKFPEAKAMITKGGMFSISNSNGLNLILNQLIENHDFRLQCGEKNANFIKENKGAVIQICDYLRI
ncbi:3-deoxy-D-manno-octulosonic acid transferase [Aestuariivivens insulae]|uniref:3-deoxy-D-manno-octulosonic acid transferase n=1 Tax=Aestuariivivens insulae TaxID=1621988 RepID=UPI001F55EDCD|nr:glycosyltransferase N-terminal domain-containing protein [Aestuariivivens insulae]